MPRKKTAIRRAAGKAGLDASLSEIIDGIEDELLVIDREYHVVFANSVVRDGYRGGVESPVGRFCYEVFYDRDRPCTAPQLNCPLGEVLEGRSISTVIHRVHIRGADTYLKVSAYPLHDSYGNTKAIIEMRRDVTAASELESHLLRRYEELLALSRVSAALSGLRELDTILRVTLDSVLNIMNGTIGGILLLDEQTQRLTYHVYQGLSTRYVEEMCLRLGEGIAGRVAQSGKSILLEDISVEPHVAHLDLVSTEGLKAFISVPLRAQDKVLGVINVASHVPRHFTTNDIHLLHSIGDQLGVAIEQARLYERLRSAQERYRQLARQTLVAQEEERRRIARELHDETSQALSGLALQLQALIDMTQMSGSQDVGFIARLKKVHSLTGQVHIEINRLIADLHPALLDTLGLVPAIRQHAEASLCPLGINVSVETKGAYRRLPLEIKTGLFRWTQGAISNIAQHSKAKNATIVVEFRDDELLMFISDDGQGFDVSKVTHIEESGRGRGVFSMKERVGLLGGTCSIESQLRQGTTAMARVSIARSEADAENKGTGSR